MSIYGIYEGKQRIPTYKMWIRNQQEKLKAHGEKLEELEDGSFKATIENDGTEKIISQEDMKKMYDKEVKQWEAKGFKHFEMTCYNQLNLDLTKELIKQAIKMRSPGITKDLLYTDRETMLEAMRKLPMDDQIAIWVERFKMAAY